jgi:hypothetical protein
MFLAVEKANTGRGRSVGRDAAESTRIPLRHNSNFGSNSDDATRKFVPRALRELNILDFLDADRRPVLIIDLDYVKGFPHSSPITPVYINSGLRDSGLAAKVTAGAEDREGAGWRSWVVQSVDSWEPYEYCNILWSAASIGTWRVISGHAAITASYCQKPWNYEVSDAERKSNTYGFQEKPVTDAGLSDTVKSTCTSSLPTPVHLGTLKGLGDRRGRRNRPRSLHDNGLCQQLPFFPSEETKHIEFFRSFDWSLTSLGPMNTWPPLLLQMCQQIMADSRPVALYWGTERAIIYNCPYIKIAGEKHPSLMGKPAIDAWPDVSKLLISRVEKAAETGQASADEEWLIFVERTNGQPEETYLSWSVIPIFQNSDFVGFYTPIFETTDFRIAERRMKDLLTMGEAVATATNLNAFWQKTMDGLKSMTDYDVPVAILYSVTEERESKHCHLRGSLGIPLGHPIIPDLMPLSVDNKEGLAPLFLKAIEAGRPISCPDKTRNNRNLPGNFKDLEWRGFGDPIKDCVIFPIRPTSRENVMGILLLGLNPRLPYDREYQQYISLINRQLATSLASSLLFEEEARRGRNAVEQAVLDQAELEERLQESRKRFETMANIVPVGLCCGTPGKSLQCSIGC